MSQFLLYNGPMQTTAKPAAVTTGTSIKTLLQVKPFNRVKIIEWGISFSGFAAAAPISVELIEVDDDATVTAHADADISRIDSVGDIAVASVAGLTLGTAATGYTSSNEGTVTALRNLDAPQLIAPTTQFIKQFSLGQEPIIQIGKFGRIRVHAAAAVDALCYMKLAIG